MAIKRPHYLVRYLILAAIFLVIIVTILTADSSVLLKRNESVPSVVELEPSEFNRLSQCYKSPDKSSHMISSINYFEDILDATVQPKQGETIFFHETTCTKTGIVQLNAK